MKSVRAFTLIEMIVTLCITGLVLGIFLKVPPQIIHDQTLINFSSELDHQFNLLKERALLNNEYLLVQFEKDSEKITVKNLKTQNRNTLLKLPIFLTLTRNTQIRFYGEKGISPLTIVFRDLNNHKVYYFTLQMGWGINHFATK